MMAVVRSRIAGTLKGILGDALYRGSMLLLLDSAAVSVFGFVFWTLAARTYTATAVGTFSGITAGVSLLGTIAALGLPNTITRHLSGSPDARRLVLVSITAIALVGGVVCLLTVIILGPHLPAALHLRQHGGLAFLVTSLVILTAVSTTVNAGLVAVRASQAVLLTSVAGAIVKIIAVIMLTEFGSAGLLLAYGIGLLLASGLGGLALGRRLTGTARSGPIELLRRHVSMTAGSYLANILGILPATVVPLLMLVTLGAVETAQFTVAFLTASVLNFIPAVGYQVLFAEASRPGQQARAQFVKALKWVYGLLLPAMVVVLVAAPLILRVFGPGYAAAGTGCLRWLALSTLFTGGTYLLEAVLIARDRMPAYIFMNGAGALLALGFVAALVSRGITAAAFGWAVARGLSLLLCVLVVKFSGGGRRHRPIVPRTPGGPADDTHKSGGGTDQLESAGRRATGAGHQVPDAS
jgi:O-antigen/teichoic acid export membrane protein